ncbi:MAG: hypothetical protein LBH44_03570 [Treponema sp.]|jgi:ubiquinone biosynthesis protein UbiJ|nr:hypothetical protein [Treponema sp.]
MDDRKRRIEELERLKRENRASLDTLLDNFGEHLYNRIGDMAVDFEDVNQYKRFQRDIASSNSSIFAIEEQNRRFKEIEESIEKKEHEEKEKAKELAHLYGKLGKVLLENHEFDDFTAVFREQADVLTAKVESLESRIGELENKEGGNVFSWIGKSAQGLVLRSFLTKAHENRDQLLRSIGEKFISRNQSMTGGGEADSLCAEIEKLRNVSRSLLNELSVLRDEKRVISAGYGVDGSPQKQIQNIKHHIAHVREELRALYMNFGAQVAGIQDAGVTPERKYFIDTFVSAEDGEVIGRAVRLNQSILDDDAAIGKLRASIAIDEERAKIDKYRRSIDDKKDRIAEHERAIIDLENNIKDAQVRIEELQKLL